MTAWRYEISLLVLKNIFQHTKRNFVSPRSHVISSIYVTNHITYLVTVQFSFPQHRFTDLAKLAVVGGKLDMISPQNIGKKFADELAVTLLNSRGMVGVSVHTHMYYTLYGTCSWYNNDILGLGQMEVRSIFRCSS